MSQSDGREIRELIPGSVVELSAGLRDFKPDAVAAL